MAYVFLAQNMLMKSKDGLPSYLSLTNRLLVRVTNIEGLKSPVINSIFEICSHFLCSYGNWPALLLRAEFGISYNSA